MATVRRNGVAIDIGPAAAGDVDGIAAIGRLSAVKGSDSGSLEPAVLAVGVGAVERRRATADELARLDVAEPAAAPVRPGPAMHLVPPAAVRMAESRRRGNERMLALKGQRPAAPEEEEPMEATAPPAGVSVPCADCLHAPVCALKGQLAPYLVRTADAESITEPAPGLRLVDVVRLERIECDHHLAAAPMAVPEPIRAEHGGERWRTLPPDEARALRQPGRHPAKSGEEAEKAERAARVIAAVARNGGDRTAAAKELGMKTNAVSMVLKFADRHQAVPA